nr:helix-turn-helix domain-containing protein [Fredinandcohnia onubensis]
MDSIQINRYITTEELTEYLDVKSKNTIYTYIKTGLIKPINKEDWYLDSSYLFRIEDAIKLKEHINNLKPLGLTTGEAAEFLKCSVSTIIKYIKKGLLNAETKEYKGRIIYFVNKQDLSAFAKKNSINKKRKTFFSKKRGIFLYQTLVHRELKSKARIMQIEDDQVLIVTEKGDIFSANNLEQYGYEPTIIPNLNVKHKNNKAFIKFVFPLPDLQETDSPVCDIIEAFVYEIGPQNMRINKEQNAVILEIKPTSLPYNKLRNNNSLKWIEKYIVSGELYPREEKIHFKNNLDTITIHVKSEFKKQIKKAAKESNMSLEKYVIEKIKSGIGD